jgi:hypothetical protein
MQAINSPEVTAYVAVRSGVCDAEIDQEYQVIVYQNYEKHRGGCEWVLVVVGRGFWACTGFC